MGQRANVYKVPEKQWRKWSVAGRETFNWIFGLMFKSPRLFRHPSETSKLRTKEQVKTPAWNAAWLAADAVTAEGNRIMRQIRKHVHG